MTNEQSTSEASYRIAGSVVAPGSHRLVEALSLPGWRVRDKNGEVVLDVSGFSASIYEAGIDRPDGREFLMSATFDGDAGSLNQVLAAFDASLRGHGFEFEIEVQDERGVVVTSLRNALPKERHDVSRRALFVTFNATGAPESPHGRERLELRDDGHLRYQQWFAGRHVERESRASAVATRDVFAALAASTFPAVTSHDVPPGASLVEIDLAEGDRSQSVSLHLYKGLTYPGYGDLLRRLGDWAKALRQSEGTSHPDLAPVGQ